eukprot:TRINITY_DN5659_c0_g1_i1.p1 TRINITY_DN5659_c0_g1~~TRINITY_DN5659_c0_g1_i1.p1  ORF type:complete len:413 (-),score=51.01 TRINITY_DN5659_c0_g1_i1:523-1761(-)
MLLEFVWLALICTTSASVNLEWKPNVYSSSFAARSCHSVVSDGNQVFLYGGRDRRLLSDFQSFSPKENSWKALPADSSRGRHTMSVVDNKIYLISGKGNGYIMTSMLADMAIFDMEASRWSTRKLPSTIRPRLGHTATVVGNEIWVFGGSDGSQAFFNDLHIFNTVSGEWRNSEISGTPPSPRSGHSATLVADGKIIIFGGESGSDTLNDVHVLDTQKATWTQVSVEGEKPARYGHGALFLWGQLFIVGGNSAFDNLKDVPVLRKTGETSYVWEWKQPTGPNPLPLYYFGNLVLVEESAWEAKAVIFGGYNLSHANSDVHTLVIQRQGKDTAVPLSSSVINHSSVVSAIVLGFILLLAIKLSSSLMGAISGVSDFLPSPFCSFLFSLFLSRDCIFLLTFRQSKLGRSYYAYS